MSEPLRSRRIRYALLLALFLFWLLIASQIPYTHDDWDWGLPLGLDQLLTASVNGRYAGNACVVLLTRSSLLKTLVMALAFTLLPVWELKLVSCLGEEESQTPLLLLAASLLFALLPTAIWQQSCGWVSGFCNFMFSALMLLGGHRLLFRPAALRQPSPLFCAGVFVFGLLMQLFLENVAIYSVAVSLSFLLLRRIRDRRFDHTLLALLLGNLAGLFLLFSSSVFEVLFTAGQAMQATRELVPSDHTGLLPYLLRCLLYYIKYFPSIWGRAPLLCCLVLGSLVFLAEKKQRSVLAPVNAVFALFFVCAAFFGEPQLSTEKRSLYLSIALSFLYFCAVGLECLLLFRKRPQFCARLLFYWVSAPLVLLPLAITTVEGGRLFFIPYVLESVFALLLLAELNKTLTPPWRRALSLAMAALLFVGCLRLGLAYQELGAAYRERLAMLAQPSGTVVLPELPHKELIWFPDPEIRTRLGYFRAFYGVSDELEVLFESGAPFAPW